MVLSVTLGCCELPVTGKLNLAYLGTLGLTFDPEDLAAALG